MKKADVTLRVLLVLVLSIPVLGTLGVFPPPTADMYAPPGWAFMEALMNTGYMMWMIALTCFACIVLLLMGRTALAAVILAPFTVNVIAFSAFLNGNLFAASAILAWMLLLLNAYFLWANREKYRGLW